MKLTAYLFCFLMMSYGAPSQAGDHYNVQGAAGPTGWCYGLLTPKTFIQPIVECFTNIDPNNDPDMTGIIPAVTTNFLTVTNGYYMPMVGAMFLLAVAYFGFKITVGDVQNLRAETIILGFKMAGIVLYMHMAPTIYLEMVTILQQLSQSIAQTASTFHSQGLCVVQANTESGGGSTWQGGLWSEWDCIFGYLLGISSKGLAISGMASFLVMIAFSMGTGMLVMLVGMYMIMALLIAAFRFVHVYLMSVLALSFVFCIGYLLVPLLLYKQTIDYFKRWLTMVFGYILTPIIMFGFMSMMLMAIDITVFSGGSSVYCKIGGGSANNCGTAVNSNSFCPGVDAANMWCNITASITPWDKGGGFGSNNWYVQSNFMEGFMNALNGTPSMLQNYSPSPVQTNLCSNFSGVFGHVSQFGNCGTGVSSMPNSTYDSQIHPEMTKVGIPMISLNLDHLANDVGSSCTSTELGNGGENQASQYFNNCPWMQGVLISLGVAGLVAYVMLTLLTYVPTLVSNLTQDLVRGDFLSSGWTLAKNAMFGQNDSGGIAGALTKAVSGSGASAVSSPTGSGSIGRGIDSILSSDRD